MLHNDKELFQQLILHTAQSKKTEESVIEKDYFVTLLLEKIVMKQPDVIFKGGTSLSKCYKLIERFSEDIDLNIQGNTKPTEGQRKHLKSNIISAIDELGFNLINYEDIRSRRDFNRYMIDYSAQFSAGYLKRKIIVETAIFMRSYPSKRMKATSYIYDFLLQNGYNDIIKEYSLHPFELNVQTADRTLIDKLYALGDYYLDNKIREHSRHIYDIYKLLDIVSLDDELKKLKDIVREERKKDQQCPSANNDIDFQLLLSDIIEKEVYRSDYEEITESLLFESVSYDTAIKALKQILKSNLFK
ncbi:MAG: nucleotidyl transferase AbiEii/AbiGii toxin family protein [Oscillospiraceae bacterium]|nr:nucleotidyl transferase AbiEii/AbiGii toxin family protein [Oscillospiraceae bacterium]